MGLSVSNASTKQHPRGFLGTDTVSSASSDAVTLLSSGPEVQYVALRNILLVIQRRPIVLQNEVKVFFCKYNDPIYVKVTKLELLFMLASEKNIKEVLTELREYVIPFLRSYSIFILSR